MKSNTKKIIILLVLGMGFVFLPNIKLNFDYGQKTNVINPKESAGYFESFIHVDGNWSDTRDTYDWCTGSGTWGDPYIIENVTIDASSSPTGSGILIMSSTNAYFIIRNCTIYNAAGVSSLDAGIRLHNTRRGTIFNNTCSNNENYGITLYFNSNNNTISENVVINNQKIGLYLSLNCKNNKITSNTFINNTFGGLTLWNNCGYNNITGNRAYDNEDEGIYLDQSCDNNTLSGNYLIGNEVGIRIADSDNNTITDNTATENLFNGIQLHGSLSSSENNAITGNTVNNNYEHGIKLQDDCHFNNITGNTINDNNLIGIYLQTTNNNNTIKNNTINRNEVGIGLVESHDNNVSDNILKENNWCIFEDSSTGNNISNNNCTPPSVQEPFVIDGIVAGVGAHNWTWAINQGLCTGAGTKEVPYVIQNLKVSGFGIKIGIEIRNSNVFFIIQQCEIYNSETAGIVFNNVSNGQLIENNCSNNLGNGILLSKDCLYNNITDNVANNNDGNGINLHEKCDFNEIIANVANHNDNDGIYIGDNCDNNTISNNDVSSNVVTGITIEGGGMLSSYNNTISENTAKNNNYGIRFQEDCHFNKILRNVIKGNNLGIFLKDLGCSNNSIYKNFFLGNVKHGIDDGADNKWNSSTVGNYWDNHTGPDVNDDGIVDTQYNISGTPGGIDYLPIAEDGAPAITINSPDPDNVFAVNSPSFNVRITDDYLDEMWYTIDGGLTNFTFTDNGTIDPTAWSAFPDGPATITFYASDIPGNIGTAGVNIIKDTVAPVIIINSPAEGDRFSANAPLFNITIIEDNLDAIRYSFNGGITTYAITDNAIFNQTAWIALSQGDVTITFYARDLAGNEASESVTVIKSVPSDLDPGVIITIVVISIVGGVAILAGVYVFMKKRATPA